MGNENTLLQTKINIAIKFIIAPFIYMFLSLPLFYLWFFIFEFHKLNVVTASSYLVGIFLFGWLGLWLYFSLLYCSIRLTENQLLVLTWKNGFIGIDIEAKKFKELRFPKTIKKVIAISDISTIIYGKVPFIKKFCENQGDNLFLDILLEFKNNTKKLQLARASLNFKTYIYILEKTGVSHLVDVSQYSEKSVFKILVELKNKGVDVGFNM